MKIYTYTILYSAAPAFVNRLPYVCAILEDAHGKRFASMLEGYVEGMDIRIGQSVRAVEGSADGKIHYSLA